MQNRHLLYFRDLDEHEDATVHVWYEAEMRAKKGRRIRPKLAMIYLDDATARRLHDELGAELARH